MCVQAPKTRKELGVPKEVGSSKHNDEDTQPTPDNDGDGNEDDKKTTTKTTNP